MEGESTRESVSEIVSSINDYLPPTQESTSKPLKICRVPNHLREIHKPEFDPELVSIGPLHHHANPHLKDMEEHKKRFLFLLLDSMVQTDVNGTPLQPAVPLSQGQYETISNANKIESLVVAMNKLEANARACYSETFDAFGSKEFVKMMIFDGCFVVKLLRLYAQCDKGQETVDPIFNTPWRLPMLQRDLLLFENQLPYSVLEKLFEITKTKADNLSLKDLTLKFFNPLLRRDQDFIEQVHANPDHLLGLFRSTFISSFISDRWSSTRHSHNDSLNTSITMSPRAEDQHLIHCVTELKQAGVSFKIKKKCNLLDIEFKNGTLNIPPLSIDDNTCPVFLNFIAYEQCNISVEPYFTHYCLFFDSLVNSSKDVEHLHYRRIIDPMLGSDEDVAELCNKLCKNVAGNVYGSYLFKMSKEVNQYFRKKSHRRFAILRDKYFSNPWSFISVIAASFLIVLTMIQTVFSVISYFLPRS